MLAPCDHQQNCRAILTSGREDVPSKGAHRRAQAGILLLQMLGATWLLANPALELRHPPFELRVEGVLLPSQLIRVDEEHDGPFALAGWAVKASNLEEKMDDRCEILLCPKK